MAKLKNDLTEKIDIKIKSCQDLPSRQVKDPQLDDIQNLIRGDSLRIVELEKSLKEC
jgi:hypothetical protein